MEDIGDESQRDHRENELDHVRVEGHEFTQRDLPGNHLAAAEPQDQHKRQADQGRQRGHEHAPGANQLQVARDVLAVGSVEAAISASSCA